MLNGETIDNLIAEIVSLNNLGEIKCCERLNIGYSRIVYRINEEYVIKICVNEENEHGIRNEIKYFTRDSNDFHPRLISYDDTKSIIPYVYTIEENIKGKNLFEVWGVLSDEKRDEAFDELISILKGINSIVDVDTSLFIRKLEDEFERYFDAVVKVKILNNDQLKHLKKIKETIKIYFKNAKCGFIHGDLHFNNIIYSEGQIKIIDFENFGLSFVDREFDSINRMIRNPNSFIKKGQQEKVNECDYKSMMGEFEKRYSSVCSLDNFNKRLLIYDCINSLKWLPKFPNHKLYYEVLFEKSKSLISSRR